MAESKAQEIPVTYHPGKGFTEQISYALTHTPMFAVWDNYLGDAGGEMIVKGQISTPDLTIQPLLKTPWYTASDVVKCGYAELWDGIRGFIYGHVELADDRLFDVLTAWVFCTWISERFTVIPYLKILGSKASGKTRLMEVLRQISYRGIKSSDVSSSAMYRIVEKWKPTLFFDESEIYNKGLREDIQGLFNSGYTRGDFIIRVKDPQTDELAFFETYGFKVFAGTETLRDTLESRCIHINMMKNVRPIRFKVDEATAEGLRNKLLYFRFKQLEEMEKQKLKDVKDLNDTQGMPTELGWCDGRFAELFSCLVEIAKVVG